MSGQTPDVSAAQRQVQGRGASDPDAWHNLAVALFRSERFTESLDAVNRADALQPGRAEVLNTRALILTSMGRYADAVAGFTESIKLQPNLHQLYCNRAIALQKMEHYDQAIADYERSLSLNPDYENAVSNLGVAMLQSGRRQQAADLYRDWLRHHRPSMQIHVNYGEVLNRSGDFKSAEQHYRAATLLQPSLPQPFYNLAISLGAQGKLDEAYDTYRHALSMHRNYPEALNNLGNLMKDLGQVCEGLSYFDQALAIGSEAIDAGGNKILAMHYCDQIDAAQILAEARRWNLRMAEPLRASVMPAKNNRDPDRKLRIGYVSADFRDHVVGRNILPLLQNHDRRRFEIFGYCNNEPTNWTQKFIACTDQWRQIECASDAKAAEQIRADGIDILVDLAGHTSGNRLLVFARKPTPLAVTFGGYPGGTGLWAIDYRLSDSYLDPPGQTENHYVEKILRLPHSFWCYDPEAMEVARGWEVGELPAQSAGYVTFGCLSNPCKMTAHGLSMWRNVLTAIPDARMILLCPEGKTRPRVLSSLGVDPSRITFVSHAGREDYLKWYSRVDLCLDTFPYNGHTTSLDALWMGVPAVTRPGETAVSRAGWSQLSNLNLTELAAQSDQQFMQIAVNCSKDITRLAELRRTLRDRMRNSPLTDGPGFARDIESAYRQMWQTWCAA